MLVLRNPTPRFLTLMSVVFFFGALANAYFIFIPSRYTAPEFDRGSVWDWTVFLCNTLFIIYFYLILKNVPSRYARTYWRVLLAIFAAGYAEKYFIRLPDALAQTYAALACCLISAVSLLYRNLHKKYPFSLFAGLSYRIKIR